jgi:signal transduction histidine kinase
VAEQVETTVGIEGGPETVIPFGLDRAGTADLNLRAGIARELHDQVVQTMYAIKVELENFRISQYGRQAVLGEVDLLEQLTLEVLHNLRRIVSELREDPALRDGLILGLRNHLIPRFERLSGQRVVLRVSRSWPSRLNEPAEVNVYRIIHEALSNTLRHDPGVAAAITLEVVGRRAIVSIADVGNSQVDSAFPRLAGTGVLGMRERAAVLGGRLTVGSGRQGMTVRATFPLPNLLP